MRGRLIVIDGLDGSGKALQRGLLEEVFLREGVPHRGLSFPNYGSNSSALVKMYLGGDFGQHPGDVNAYAASTFYAVDRYAGFRRDWGGFYEEGGLLLADRYTTSNIIHQCAKLPREEWEGFIAWLEDFEYEKLSIPRPDLVFFLDVEPEVSQKLLYKRYAQEDRRDIHERDLDYLLNCRKVALWAVEALGWRQVACTEAGQMRPPETIHNEIVGLVKEAL